MAGILSLVVIMMGIRLCLLRKYDVPITDGRNTLLKYYLVFTIGYIMRVINDWTNEHSFKDKPFAKQLMFDFCLLINDAIPITCLLYFHYQNFKPHQHELIIRLDRSSSSQVHNEMEDSDLLQDGMFNQALLSHDSVMLSNGRIS